MANEKDFYAFPTGQSGLTPAVIPTGQGLDVQPLMTAIQQRMLNKYRGDQITLDLQKMAQDAKYQEGELQFKRDQLAAEADLRSAQAENQRAQANYHNKASEHDANVFKSKWEYEKSLVPQLAEFRSKVDTIKAKPGSDDWLNEFSALRPDYEEALATEPGRRLLNSYNTTFSQRASALAQGQRTMASQLATTATKYGVPMEAFGSLTDDVENDTKNVWDVNYNKPGDPKSGVKSRFAWFPKDDPKAGPTPLSAVTEDNKDSLRPVTIFGPQVKGIVDLQKSLTPVLQGQGTPPLQYLQQPQQQAPSAQFRWNPSTGIQPYNTSAPPPDQPDVFP